MHNLSPNLRGIIFMLLSTATFVTNDTLMKLATEGLPPFQVLMMRGFFASIWALPVLLMTGNGPRLRMALNPWVVVRNLCELAAVLCFIVALVQLPIADITAINQTTPMLLILGVALFLGERVGGLRLGLVALGFLGALLVAQPGGQGVSPYVILGFCCAICGAARDLAGRKVPSGVPSLVVAYSVLLTVFLGAGIAHLSFEDWVMPSGRHMLLLAGAGLFLTFGQFFWFLAYRTGATGVVAPFAYTFAIWAVISGLVVFGALPNALAMGGIALILLSGVSIALLDERKRRLLITA